MMLTVRGLPPDIIVSDIRLIIQQQCGVSRVLVDELRVDPDGTGSVTIGCLDAADVDKVICGLHGARIESFTLEAVPYQPDQVIADRTSNGDIPNNGFEIGIPAPPQRGHRIPPWQRGIQNQMPNPNGFGLGASSQALNSGNVPPWQEGRQDFYEPRFQRTAMELHQPDYRDRSPLAPRDLQPTCGPMREKRRQRSAREPPPPLFRRRPDLGRRPGERTHLPGTLKRQRSPSPIGSLSFGRHEEAKFARRDPFPQRELARLHQPEFHVTNLGSPFELQHAPSHYISTSPFGAFDPFGNSRSGPPPLMGSPPRQFSDRNSISGPPIGTFRRARGFSPLARIRKTPFSDSTKKRSVPQRIQSQRPVKTSTKKGKRAIVVNNPSAGSNQKLTNSKLISWTPIILYEMIGSKPVIKSGIKEKYKSLISAFEEALLMRVRDITGSSKPADAKHLVELYRAKFPPSDDRAFLLAVSDQLGLPIPNTVDEMLLESPWLEPPKIADKVFDEARAHAASVLATSLLNPGATSKSEIPQEEKKVYRYLRLLINSRMSELTVDSASKMMKVEDLLKLYRCGRTAESDRELIDLAIAEHNLKNPTIVYKGQFCEEVGESSTQVADTPTQVRETLSEDGETSEVEPPAVAADFTTQYRVHAAAGITLQIMMPNATSRNELQGDEKKIYKYVRAQVELRLLEMISECGLIITTKNIPEVRPLYEAMYTDGDELIRIAIEKHDAEHPTSPYNGVHKREILPQPTAEQTRDAVALQKRRNAAAVIALRLLQRGAKGKSDLQVEEKRIYQTVRELVVERLADVEVACGADKAAVKVLEIVKAYRRKYDAKSDKALLDRAICEYSSTTKQQYKGVHAKFTPSVPATVASAPTEVDCADHQAQEKGKPADPLLLKKWINATTQRLSLNLIGFEGHVGEALKSMSLKQRKIMSRLRDKLRAKMISLIKMSPDKPCTQEDVMKIYRSVYDSDKDQELLKTITQFVEQAGNRQPSLKENLQMLIRKDYAASIIASEVFELNQSQFFKPDELTAMEKKNALTWISEIIADRLRVLDTQEMKELTPTSDIVRVYREHYPQQTDVDVLATVARDLLCPQYATRTKLIPDYSITLPEDGTLVEGGIFSDDDTVPEEVGMVPEGAIISDDDTVPEGTVVPEGGTVPDGEPVLEGDQLPGDTPFLEDSEKPADPLVVKKWINATAQRLSLNLVGFEGRVGEALKSMTFKQKKIMSRLRDKLRARMNSLIKMSPDKPCVEEDVMKIYRSVYDSDKDQELLKLVERPEDLQLSEPTPFDVALWIKKTVAPLAHRLLYTPERPSYGTRERKIELINKVKAAFYVRCADAISNAKEKPKNLQEVKDLYHSTYSESDNEKTAEDVRKQFLEELKVNVEANQIPHAPQVIVQDNSQFAEDVSVDNLNLNFENQMPVVDLVQSEESPEIVQTNVGSANGTADLNLTLGVQPPLQPVMFKKRQRLRYKPRRRPGQGPGQPHEQASDISIDDIHINMDDLEDY